MGRKKIKMPSGEFLLKPGKKKFRGQARGLPGAKKASKKLARLWSR